MYSLNPQMTTSVKIQVQEIFKFGCFSKKPSLVVKHGKVGSWCQDLRKFQQLGFVRLMGCIALF